MIMSVVDYVAIAAIILIISASVLYIIRAKRRGEKCVGCPYAKMCGKKFDGTCGHAHIEENNDNK